MSKYKTNWNKVREQISNKENKQSYGDDRFWKLTVDKDKKGSAVIRFLPDKDGTPFEKYFSHWFRYDGQKVYAGKCPTTIGNDCPICSKNTEYWNTGFETDKKIASSRKRKQHFVSNILVIKDPANPQNEGKVFLYDFGVQIHEIYNTAMYGVDPDTKTDLDEDETIFMPCALVNDIDPETGRNECGADFILKATKKADSDWQTYAHSKFKKQSELFDGDEAKIDEVMEKVYSLAEFVDPKTFPDEASVRNKLVSILGPTGAPKSNTPDSSVDEEDESEEDEIPSESSDEDEFINSLL